MTALFRDNALESTKLLHVEPTVILPLNHHGN